MENPPTFETVISLANSLAKKAEESKEAIQKNNAHRSVDTQLIYQEGHDLTFDDALIQFTADQIGGDFKYVSNHQPKNRELVLS